MWLSETKRFAPTERGTIFQPSLTYKHLAPNGAKTTTSKNSDRFVARTLESGEYQFALHPSLSVRLLEGVRAVLFPV